MVQGCIDLVANLQKGIGPEELPGEADGLWGAIFMRLPFFLSAKGDNDTVTYGVDALQHLFKDMGARMKKDTSGIKLWELQEIQAYKFLLKPEEKAELKTWVATLLATMTGSQAAGASSRQAGPKRAKTEHSSEASAMSWFG